MKPHVRLILAALILIPSAIVIAMADDPPKPPDRAPIDVLAFGAVADNRTDCADAFEKAIAALPELKVDVYDTYSRGGTISIPPGTYRLSRTLHLRRGVVLEGGGGGGWSAGTQLRFPPGVTGIHVHYWNPETENRADWAAVRNLAVLSDRPKDGSLSGDGILIEGVGVRVENVWVKGFGRDGVHIEAGVPNSNANLFRLTEVMTTFNGRHGLYTAGNDANAGTAIGVNASNNGADGFAEKSFLGNTYIGCHADSNAGSNYNMGDAAGVNASVLMGCYSEGDFEKNFFGQYVTAFGGAMSTNPASKGAFVGSIGGGPLGPALAVTRPVMTRNAGHPQRPWTITGGTDPASGIMHAFGYDVSSDGKASPQPYYFQVGDAYSKDNFSLSLHNSRALTPYVLTTGNDPTGRGGGYLWTPRGALVGASKALHGTAAGPPADGEWKRGDLLWNAAPAAGSPLGWVCLADGAPGTWTEISGRAGKDGERGPRGEPGPPGPKGDTGPPGQATPVKRVRGWAKIERNQMAVTVTHDLGGEPDAVLIERPGTADVWVADVTETTIKFCTAKVAPANGIPFTYSASRQAQ